MLRAAVLLLLASSLFAATVGPSAGSLVIAGGGALGPEIWQRFMALAGGPDALVVYIPTAAETEPKPDAADFLRQVGFRNVVVLHTRDKKIADTESFAAPLFEARGVWFAGGRQWRIVDSYEGTRTEQALMGVLRRGGVIGGTSAGATIQGSYLVRGARTGNQIMMAPGYERGFGYLRNTAIDQHLLKRKRENDLWQVIDKHPHLLGIGIDESTAILVRGDEFEVIGVSKVAIYDAANTGKTMVFLDAGDRFALDTRKKSGPSQPSALR
jgi:cyanophycinase